MNPCRAVLSLVLVGALAVLMLILPVAAHAQEPAEVAADRQILVMLRLSPPHFRPNASYGGDYGDGVSRAAQRRIASRIARDNQLELLDDWPMPLIGIDCFVMRVPSAMSVENAVARVSRNRMVAWSEPMRIYRAQNQERGGRDPLFAAQTVAASWRLADLHRVSTGRGVSIAVVDSRIEVGHPDLAGQFAADEDFVPNRPERPETHGTGVAGVIAAKAGNGVGIAGVAPGARLMALRACWQTGGATEEEATVCDTLSLAKALIYAVERRAQVINLSLSGPPGPLLQRLIEIMLARKASVVAAFDPTLPNGGFPASQQGVIAVADESLPSLPPEVYAAPGRDVLTTQPGGRWYLVNGSSYAAAQVSGLVALLREQHEAPTQPVLIATRASGGKIDACATIVRTSAACDCECAVARRAATKTR